MSRRPLLLPLVPLYAAGLKLKQKLLESGRLPHRMLENAVVSVGSVSAGGAGKTPLVLALARALSTREYAVRILTRGYGRNVSVVERVDPSGDASRFGDEPLLLARRAGVPVYVGGNRYEAGRLAEATPASQMTVHLLDDGFQHRQLLRDLDLVLLTRQDVEEVLLPAGNLREPLTMLREADVIVVREEEAASLGDFISVLTRESKAPLVWPIHRSLDLPMRDGLRLAQRPLAFCGIARPVGFFSMLEAQGVRPCTTVTFPDHHRYDERDVKRLLAKASRHAADGWITTEKDAVKLRPEMCRCLEQIGPLIVPELNVTFVNERAAIEQLIAAVPRLDRRHSRR